MGVARRAADSLLSKRPQTKTPAIADGWSTTTSTFAPDAGKRGCLDFGKIKKQDYDTDKNKNLPRLRQGSIARIFSLL